MRSALILISLGVGYWVYLTGSKEKEGLKKLGQAIGALIMIGSVLLILAGAMRCSYMKKKCLMMAKFGCPVSSAPAVTS